MGFSFAGPPIGDSEDLRRIRNLPVRSGVLPELPNLALSPDVALRPIQVQALSELRASRGLFAPIAVGGGKTLITLLAPILLDAKRPLLLLPSSLIEKTERERRKLGLDWRVSNALTLKSYWSLSHVSGSGYLEYLKPDVIIGDEIHKLKHRKSAVTKRVARYMHAHPETIFVALSGTILEKALDQFAHIMAWCLKDGAPIPLDREVLYEWAEALDPKVDPMKRREAGALLSLTPGAETAAEAFQGRLRRTQGIVFSNDDDGYHGSLQIERVSFEALPVTDDNFAALRDEACTPDGWALTEATDLYRVARQLALGLCYEWRPRPPEEWMIARRAWAKFVREVLSRSRTLDSELQVVHAVERGDIQDGGLLQDWRDKAPTFQINVVDTWYDESALNAAEAWLEASDEPSIVWTEHSFFARELSKRTGLDYFGPQGLNKRKERIDVDTRLGYGKSCIASVQSNGTGRNLQAWCRNLVTAPAPDAGALEQLIGRTHRQGQLADTVTVDFFWVCREHDSAIERSIRGAQEDAALSGQKKKILLADIVPAGNKGTGAAWRT